MANILLPILRDQLANAFQHEDTRDIFVTCTNAHIFYRILISDSIISVSTTKGKHVLKLLLLKSAASLISFNDRAEYCCIRNATPHDAIYTTPALISRQ